MRKLWIPAIFITLILIGYFLVPEVTEGDIELSLDVVEEVSAEVVEIQQKPIDITSDESRQKISELTTKYAQCKSEKLSSGTHDRKINRKLATVFENELKNGKSERELLAYANQYSRDRTFIFSAISRAKRNIEKSKYTTTSDASILKTWRGLGVVVGFTPDFMEELVKDYDEKYGNFRGRFPATMKAQPDKADVLALLENTDSFNTYFYSPFDIGGSTVIAPSKLFVLNIEQLTLDELRQAFRGQTFSVNDAAYAINSGISFEYLEFILQHTESVGGRPIYGPRGYGGISNLADLAVLRFDLPLLKLLARKGVEPINEWGILTGLDIALENLPGKDDVGVKGNTSKYIKTLEYLNQRGYRAHGELRQTEQGEAILFRTPHKGGGNNSLAIPEELQDIVKKIELVDKSFYVQQLEPDDSAISKVIASANAQSKSLNERRVNCDSYRRKLELAQGYESRSKAFNLINELRADDEGDLSHILQEIDPALVNLWRFSEGAKYFKAEEYNQRSKFLEMLKDKDYQSALEYSVSTALNQRETDELLWRLANGDIQSMPIWNARVFPKSTSSLLSFSRIPIDKWKLLEREGFDFSLIDAQGRDLFVSAALASPEALVLLFEKNLSPDMEEAGPDIFDVALERSIDNGELYTAIPLILSRVVTVEPNHFSRIVRLKSAFPEIYEELIALDERLIPPEGAEPNRYKLRVF